MSKQNVIKNEQLLYEEEMKYSGKDSKDSEESNISEERNNVTRSLNEILNSFKESIKDSDQYNNDRRDLLLKHSIDYFQFHEMRRAFRNSNSYYSGILSKSHVDSLFNNLNYDNAKREKYLMITFSTNNRNSAKCNIRAVYGHSFGNYVSCYSQTFLNELFEIYRTVRIIKALDDLKGEIIGGRSYRGDFNLVSIHCEGLIDNEFNARPPFYDVVHDPD